VLNGFLMALPFAAIAAALLWVQYARRARQSAVELPRPSSYTPSSLNAPCCSDWTWHTQSREMAGGRARFSQGLRPRGSRSPASATLCGRGADALLVHLSRHGSTGHPRPGVLRALSILRRRLCRRARRARSGLFGSRHVARRHPLALRLLMRPLLNGGTVGASEEGFVSPCRSVLELIADSAAERR
jgi:hypothetical protein